MLEDLSSSLKSSHLHHLIAVGLALLCLSTASRVSSFNLPPLSVKVNDFAYVLNPTYRTDLNWRLTRFAEKTGYAIHIVTMEGDYSENLLSIATELLESNQLENRASAGTVLVIIAAQDAQAAIATSKNLRGTFSRFRTQRKIENMMREFAKEPEITVEYVVDAILSRIDRWFYVLDPPSPSIASYFVLVRSPTAEIILLPTAPLLGLMTGLVLMAFTSAGRLPWLARFFVSGYLGCAIVIVVTFIIRQPGGILPGMFYYGAAMGFAVSGTVGALRPLWFSDTFRGKTSNKWWAGPVYFRRG
jgi:uncharacterized membrane protein YgcG